MPQKKAKGTELSVFKGREARLNRAIFQALSRREPLSTREICKSVARIRGLKHTSYSTVNKRVRSLEESGYLTKVAVKEMPGGIANYYALTPRAYLAAYFNAINIENLLARIDLDSALSVFAEFVGALGSA
jgi:DNA-binding PadR family transcriptional regulator